MPLTLLVECLEGRPGCKSAAPALSKGYPGDVSGKSQTNLGKSRKWS